MQLASGGDWPPPPANTMVQTQGTHIYICSTYIYIHTYMVLILRGCMKPGSAKIVRPKSSRNPTWRKGSWNFLVERSVCRFICSVNLTMNSVNLQAWEESTHTGYWTSRRHRSTKGFQATHLAKGSPGSLPSNDFSLFNFVFFRCLVQGCGKPGVQPQPFDRKVPGPLSPGRGPGAFRSHDVGFSLSLCVALHMFCKRLKTCTCGRMYTVSTLPGLGGCP